MTFVSFTPTRVHTFNELVTKVNGNDFFEGHLLVSNNKPKVLLSNLTEAVSVDAMIVDATNLNNKEFLLTVYNTIAEKFGHPTIEMPVSESYKFDPDMNDWSISLELLEQANDLLAGNDSNLELRYKLPLVLVYGISDNLTRFFFNRDELWQTRNFRFVVAAPEEQIPLYTNCVTDCWVFPNPIYLIH